MHEITWFFSFFYLFYFSVFVAENSKIFFFFSIKETHVYSNIGVSIYPLVKNTTPWDWILFPICVLARRISNKPFSQGRGINRRNESTEEHNKCTDDINQMLFFRKFEFFSTYIKKNLNSSALNVVEYFSLIEIGRIVQTRYFSCNTTSPGSLQTRFGDITDFKRNPEAVEDRSQKDPRPEVGVSLSHSSPEFSPDQNSQNGRLLLHKHPMSTDTFS